MVRTFPVRLNAAHPELPLMEASAIVGSPSTAFITRVPATVGTWTVAKVYAQAEYPDGTITTVEAARSAEGIWTATLPATQTSGRVRCGFMVLADGIDENDEPVTGYTLGIADMAVYTRDLVVQPGTTAILMKYFDTAPDPAKKGDVAPFDGVIKMYNGTQWVAFGGISDYTELTNLPSINSVTLIGNKSAADLGLATIDDATLTYANLWVWTNVPSSVTVGQPVYEEARSEWTVPAVIDGDSTTIFLDDSVPPTATVLDVPITVGGEVVTMVATLTAQDYYVLGSQTDKPLATEAEAAALRTAVAGKLSKAGDTMTGALTVPQLTVGTRNSQYIAGIYSTAEGENNTANGQAAHAEGGNTTASGAYSHAEGENNTANGYAAHAEGGDTTASGAYSHAEGDHTIANSNPSTHAEGSYTNAFGSASHAEGAYTETQNSAEHAEGKCNASHKASTSWGNAGNTLSSTGFGSSSSDRKNAVETMQDGKTYVYGIGGYDGTNPDTTGVKDLATAVNDKQGAITASGILKGDGAGNVTAAVAGTDFQTPLTIDATPTDASTNPVQSGGVYTALGNKQATITASGVLKGDGSGGVSAAVAGTDYQAPLTIDATPTDASTNPVQSGGVYTALGNKVDVVATPGTANIAILTASGGIADGGVDVATAMRYAIGTTLAASGTVGDRSITCVVPTKTNTADILISFPPAAPAGKARDFCVLITNTTGNTGDITFVMPSGATVYGDAFTTPCGSGETWLYSFTEVYPNTFFSKAQQAIDPFAPLYWGLYFEAEADNVTVNMTKTGSPSAVSLETSTDGTTWTTFDGEGGTTPITLTSKGDRVYFRAGSGGNTSFASDDSNYHAFTLSGACGAHGNIMSLLDNSNELNVTLSGTNCFERMFYGCANLTTAPLLPATTLARSCYSAMFRGCSALTEAPDLPATTIPAGCYNEMFYNCSSLDRISVAFTAWMSQGQTSNWLFGVASTGTFICPTALGTNETIWRDNANLCPTNWTVVNI